MAIAESLIEFKRKDSKGKSKKVQYDSNSGGDDGEFFDNNKEHSKPKHKGSGKWRKDDKGESHKAWCKEDNSESSKPKQGYFICDGSHRAYKCLKQGKLAALIRMEEEV